VSLLKTPAGELDIFGNFREFRSGTNEIHEFFYNRTKYIAKFGPFWSEIRNEIRSFSSELQAKANAEANAAGRSLRASVARKSWP
jgi:hypothetical protein